MVFEKKQLSKALAIALMVACAVAFMPLLNGQAFAAAKKPAKVKSLKASQVANTVTAKVTWKKGKNCKKYNVKVDGKIVKKNQKAKSYTTEDLTVGAHKISVAGVNGKKVGAYKTVTVNIVAPATPVASAVIDNTAPNVGDTLTVGLLDKDGKPVLGATATYQWFRINSFVKAEPIDGATAASYVVQTADVNYILYCEATVTGNTFKTASTAAVTNATKLKSVKIKGTARVGYTLETEIKDANDKTVTEGISYKWYLGDDVIKDAEDAAYVIPYSAVGKTIKVEVTGDGNTYAGTVTSEPTDVVVNSGRLSLSNCSGAILDEDGTVKQYVPAIGDELQVVNYNTGTWTYKWYRGTTLLAVTGTTYNVTATDLGQTLSVVATSGEKTYGLTTAAVCKNLAAASPAADVATVTVTSSNKTATVFSTADTATAKVTLGDTAETDITGNTVITWQYYYNGSFRTLYTDAAAKTEATGALDLSGTYYRSANNKANLVGTTLRAVATGDNAVYAGQKESAATGAVKQAFTKVEVTSDTGSVVTVGATTLTVKAYVDEDVVDGVEYTWYASKNGSNWTVVGTLSSTYVPDSVDYAYFKAVAQKNGYATGEAQIQVTYSPDGTVIPVTYDITVDGEVVAEAQVGATYTATPSVAIAEPDKYVWTIKSTGKTDVTVEGTTLNTEEHAVTVGDTIELKAVYTGTAYTFNPGNVKVTVVSALQNVIVSDDKAATGSTRHTFATPEVGDTLTAATTPSGSTAASYQWYRDANGNKADGSTKIEGATSASYTLGADDLGQYVWVEAKGGAGYTGSTAESVLSGQVKCVAKINVDGVAGTNPMVGEKLTATVVTEDGIDITEKCSFQWRLRNGNRTRTGDTYTIVSNDAGYGIEVRLTSPNASRFVDDSVPTAWNADGAVIINEE